MSLRDQVNQKYKHSYLTINNTSMICVDVDNVVYIEIYDSSLELPHIKTLEEFESLYIALTGKNEK